MGEEIKLVPDDTIVQVKNMMEHRVAYILDSGVRRRFAPKAVFNIPAGELRQLSYQPGGTALLTNYLHVGNKDLAREFGITDDIVEYDWTDKEVEDALTTSDMDVLLDALDFAPEGIKENIVDKAVELEIPDNNRRKAIKDATGADVSKMIEVKHAYDDISEEKEERAPAKRRANQKSKSSSSKSDKSTTPARRTAKA